jgi:ribosome biogenesis GTPase A
MARKHKTEFWKNVREILNASHVLLEILDASHLQDTRNPEFERKVLVRGKILIYVVNKCDQENIMDVMEEAKGFSPVVFISARDHKGIRNLRSMIMMLSKKKKIEEPVVGIFGYPNVGKSSVINSLKGRRSAKVAGEAGYTRSLKYIKSGKLLLIDSPGVLPHGETDTVKHVRIGAKNADKIRNPLKVAESLIVQGEGKIEKHYDVRRDKDPMVVIERIAKKKGLLKKGGVPDVKRAAVFILMEIRKMKLRLD